MLMDGRAQATGIRRPASDATLLWTLNAHHGVVEFTLPKVAGGRRWKPIFDTSMPDRLRDQSYRLGEAYEMIGRSTVLFALES
jgi:glycogen operon protein